MAEIGAISVDWAVSPRIVTVGSGLSEVSIQDLVDTLRVLESDLDAMDDPSIISAAGKEDLGGGVSVGITATLLDATLAFEARTTAVASGIVSSGDTAGQLLYDSSNDFIGSGVLRGATIINFTDRSIGTVRSVLDGQSLLLEKPLLGGLDNQFDIGDEYKIWNEIQCNVAGGNLVAQDTVGSGLDPIFPTFGTQIVRTSSSSATFLEEEAIQYSSFGGGVTVDVANGTSGTTFPLGTKEFPVNNITDARAIALGRGFDTLFIMGDLTLTSGDNVEDLILKGRHQSMSLLTVGSAALTRGVILKRLSVVGEFDGAAVMEYCDVYDIAYVEGFLQDCLMLGTVTLTGSGPTSIINCFDGIAGAGIPTVDMGGSGRDLIVRNYSGGLKIINLSGPREASVSMVGGRLVLDSTITNGTILVKGTGLLENNSTGTTSVNSDGLNNPIDIANQVWSELASSHVLTGSMGEILNNLESRLTVARAASLDSIPGITSDTTLIQKILRNRLELISGDTDNWVLYDDDSTTPLLTWSVTDESGSAISIQAGVPAQRTRGT